MERKACFLVGSRKEIHPVRSRNQKVVLICPEAADKGGSQQVSATLGVISPVS